MMGCNMIFKEIIWKIIPKLSLLLLLIWSIAVLISGQWWHDQEPYLVEIFKNLFQKQKNNGLESWYTKLSNHCMKCKQPTRSDSLWIEWLDGAPVAHWVKCSPTDLVVPSSSPAQDEIFSTVNRVPLHTAFHYHPPIVLIWLKYCWKERKIANHRVTGDKLWEDMIKLSIWLHANRWKLLNCWKSFYILYILGK